MTSFCWRAPLTSFATGRAPFLFWRLPLRQRVSGYHWHRQPTVCGQPDTAPRGHTVSRTARIRGSTRRGGTTLLPYSHCLHHPRAMLCAGWTTPPPGQSSSTTAATLYSMTSRRLRRRCKSSWPTRRCRAPAMSCRHEQVRSSGGCRLTLMSFDVLPGRRRMSGPVPRPRSRHGAGHVVGPLARHTLTRRCSTSRVCARCAGDARFRPLL